MSTHTPPNNTCEPPQEDEVVDEAPAWWARSPVLSYFARYQRLLSLLSLALLTLTFGGGLMISHISAKHGLLVFGSDPALWAAGGRAALRVEARALSLGERAAILSARVFFERPQTSPSTPPLDSTPLEQRLGVSLQAGVDLPREPGAWRMVIEAEAISARGLKAQALKGGLPASINALDEAQLMTLGERVSLRAERLVTLSARPLYNLKQLNPARTPDPLAPRLGQEGGELASFGADQRLSFLLPSELIIMGVRDKHTPLKGLVEVSLNQAPPQLLKLDEHGLASLTTTPQTPTVDLTARLTTTTPPDEGSVGEPVTLEVKERVWPEAHQFSLRPATQRVGPTRAPLLSLKSTTHVKALFVDLWWGERWVDTRVVPLDQSGEAQLHLSLPQVYAWGDERGGAREASPTLLWAQTYHSPYQPGETRGGSYLLYAPHEMSDERVGAWLMDQLKHVKLTKLRWPHLSPKQWLNPLPLRLALGRVARPLTDPQLIINSVASAEATAGAMKARYQVNFLVVMASLCALLMLGLGGLMWGHERRLAPLRAELNINKRRWEALGWLLSVSVILACFFGGMVYLIYVIRW